MRDWVTNVDSTYYVIVQVRIHILNWFVTSNLLLST